MWTADNRPRYNRVFRSMMGVEPLMDVELNGVIRF